MADGVAPGVLKEVKEAIGITGAHHDDLIGRLIAEVLSFMAAAGVPEGAATAGVIATGVTDLWDNGAGAGQLSRYFLMRTVQLATGKGAEDGIQPPAQG